MHAKYLKNLADIQVGEQLHQERSGVPHGACRSKRHKRTHLGRVLWIPVPKASEPHHPPLRMAHVGGDGSMSRVLQHKVNHCRKVVLRHPIHVNHLPVEILALGKVHVTHAVMIATSVVHVHVIASLVEHRPQILEVVCICDPCHCRIEKTVLQIHRGGASRQGRDAYDLQHESIRGCHIVRLTRGSERASLITHRVEIDESCARNVRPHCGCQTSHPHPPQTDGADDGRGGGGAEHASNVKRTQE
mmetsp:Transcript_74951/g.87027  ORF Transcript_74951/g.87027 Transcript_74951/m.87027 type:complete len:246 (-) Transcript_74951:167-904(-)